MKALVLVSTFIVIFGIALLAEWTAKRLVRGFVSENDYRWLNQTQKKRSQKETVGLLILGVVGMAAIGILDPS